MASGDSQQSEEEFSTNVGGIGIEPYMFEPEYDSDELTEMTANQAHSACQTSASPDLPTPAVSSWCRCLKCDNMQTQEECVCCHALPEVEAKFSIPAGKIIDLVDRRRS